jgi:hypothetical protein
MKADGFEPAVVVETSPNNFQAWLNHGLVLDATMSTRAAKHLAERFGGDPSSADWRHFGRLAGFTNPKPERKLSSGMRPFARLRSAKGARLFENRRVPWLTSRRMSSIGAKRRKASSRTDANAWRSVRLKIFTVMRLLPAIFIALICPGRSMPLAAG